MAVDRLGQTKQAQGMSIGATRAQLGDLWGLHQCDLLGLRPGDAGYPEALAMAEAGLWAYQIAQRMQAHPAVVMRLGGPCPA